MPLNQEKFNPNANISSVMFIVM